MSRALRFITGALLASACATTRVTGDLHRVRDTVTSRASELAFALPGRDDPTSAEVERILAEPLTPDGAARLALLNNREVRATLSEVGVARGQFVQAGLLPNPEFEFEARDPGGAQPAQLDLGVEVNVSAMLLAPFRAGVASSTLDAERWRAAGAILELGWSTRVAFYEAQALQQKLELRLRALASHQAAYETALELARVGNLPQLALANQLATVESARLQVAEAENAWLDAREALTRKLGLSGAHTHWTLAGVLEPVALPAATEGLEARALDASLELAELKSRAEAASRKVGLTKTEAWLPHLSAGLHGERDGALWELGGHVTVGLPIFDRAQGRRLSSESEYDALRSRTQVQEVQVRSTVRATLNRLESAGRRAEHYRERLLPARRRVLEETVRQYNAMQVSVFEVLAAERAVTEAAVSQVDATLDAAKAKAALDLVLAGRSAPLALGSIPRSTTTSPETSGGH